MQGMLSSGDTKIGFILRQGFIPRRARIEYTFECYTLSLDFFPDTFAARCAHDNYALKFTKVFSALGATSVRTYDKISHRDHDKSHELAIRAALSNAEWMSPLRVETLMTFSLGWSTEVTKLGRKYIKTARTIGHP